MLIIIHIQSKDFKFFFVGHCPAIVSKSVQDLICCLCLVFAPFVSSVFDSSFLLIYSIIKLLCNISTTKNPQNEFSFAHCFKGFTLGNFVEQLKTMNSKVSESQQFVLIDITKKFKWQSYHFLPICVLDPFNYFITYQFYSYSTLHSLGKHRGSSLGLRFKTQLCCNNLLF